MKALSLKQPWLWAITDLDKRVENRTWKPPQWAIGQRIALHASKKEDPHGYSAIQSVKWVTIPANLPLGSIVATAKIIGWLDDAGFGDVPSPCLGHLVDDEWFFGPIGWILEDIQKLDEPVPCRGALGLWDVPDDILSILQSRLSNKAHAGDAPSSVFRQPNHMGQK